MYSSALPSTSTLDGGGWSTPRPGRFTPGKDPVPTVQEAGWAPGPVWTGAENLAPTGIRSPDRPTSSSVDVPTELSRPQLLPICIQKCLSVDEPAPHNQKAGGITQSTHYYAQQITGAPLTAQDAVAELPPTLDFWKNPARLTALHFLIICLLAVNLMTLPAT